jgi:mono/diheme cytochrome c family protein
MARRCCAASLLCCKAVKGGFMSATATRLLRVIVVAGLAALAPARASAQGPGPQPPEKTRPIEKDYYQRSLDTYEFKKAATSGPERGREIFYYKCWFCHNEFTKNAPQLTGLYRRGTLLSGLPVNDENLKNRIRNGGEGMAGYKYTLSEADLDDLVSFVRDECCWNSDAPPLNPRYDAQ